MKTIGASTAPFFQRFARLSRERQPNHNRVRDVVAACRRPGKVIDELHRLEPPEHDERSPGLGEAIMGETYEADVSEVVCAGPHCVQPGIYESR